MNINYFYNQTLPQQCKSPETQLAYTEIAFDKLINDSEIMEWATNYKIDLFNDIPESPLVEVEVIRVSRKKNKASSILLKEPSYQSLSPQKLKAIHKMAGTEQPSKRQKLEYVILSTDDISLSSLFAD